MIRQVLRDGRDSGSGDPARAKLAAVGRAPVPWLDPPEGPWTVERAYAYCEEFARAHTESFPVASRFVPAAVRPHLIALYAFARSADDFADEPQYEGRRVGEVVGAAREGVKSDEVGAHGGRHEA